MGPPYVEPGRRGNWSREQTLLAFQFYCETPFGQLHGRNKRVIELANLIGRTPDAVAMKCVNMASLDPKVRARGRSGLSNASALDRKVWNEFHGDWERLLVECEAVRVGLAAAASEPAPAMTGRELDDVADYSGESRAAMTSQRIGQAFFRRAVLSGYGNRCCVSGVSDARFLVASHIVAWKDDPSIRLHPGNGLCLSAVHDKAFDNHLFSLMDDYRVVLSASLKSTKDAFLRQVFWPIEGTTISLPDRFVPEVDFVARHRRRLEHAGAAGGSS
jgi:putative restriction endonuclease